MPLCILVIVLCQSICVFCLFGYIDRFIDVDVCGEEAVVKAVEAGCGSGCLRADGILSSVCDEMRMWSGEVQDVWLLNVLYSRSGLQ